MVSVGGWFEILPAAGKTAKGGGTTSVNADRAGPMAADPAIVTVAALGRCPLPEVQSPTRSWPENQMPHKICYITSPYKTLDSKFGVQF